MDRQDSPSVQGLTVPQAIANLTQTEDTSSRYYAAWWLGHFRVGQRSAVEALLAALEDSSDRTPNGGYPLRRNAARALGKLGDRAAVMPLIESLRCEDYYVRESAAQSLEELGDVRAVAPLAELLQGGDSDITLVPNTPHLKQPYNAVLEALGQLKAVEQAEAIKRFLTHPTPRIQYAAARALYQLTQEPQYGDRLVAALQSPELQLRRSALLDLGAIGYLAAADAIAATPAENSLKLIALKGLLEHQLNADAFGGAGQTSAAAKKVMTLMDRLL
ncbi:MAG: HEAT repeat domain-containing protein [Elainellaceae cyanobacterium]